VSKDKGHIDQIREGGSRKSDNFIREDRDTSGKLIGWAIGSQVTEDNYRREGE
jgi:hypothetical protein